MDVEEQIEECIELMEAIKKSGLPTPVKVAAVGANVGLRGVQLEIVKARIGE